MPVLRQKCLGNLSYRYVRVAPRENGGIGIQSIGFNAKPGKERETFCKRSGVLVRSSDNIGEF